MRTKLLAAGTVGMAFALCAAVSQAGANAQVPVLRAQAHTAEAAYAHTAKAAYVVGVANTLVGPLLVNDRGYTIYMFTRDKRDRDDCAKIKGCLKDWPAVTTTSRHPALGPGIKPSLVGTIAYKGKLREVTYAGHPLHTYRFDAAPRSVMNIGNTQFGGDWWALNAAGKVVE